MDVTEVRKKKDIWDKLPVMSAFLTPVILAVLGWLLSNTFTREQKKREAQLEKTQVLLQCIPHLARDEAGREVALYVIDAIGEHEFAKELALRLNSEGANKALAAIGANSDSGGVRDSGDVRGMDPSIERALLGRTRLLVDTLTLEGIETPRLAALAAARAELDSGAREVGGENMGHWVRKYMQGKEGRDWPWAAGFVSWCYGQSKTGMPFGYQLAFAPIRDTFVKRGWFHPTNSGYRPQPGDVMLLSGGSAGVRHGGIVESADASVVRCIEGNSNDDGSPGGYEVCRRVRSYSGLAFGHVPDDFAGR